MRISVLGSGTWGSCLANLLAENGHDIVLWGRNSSKINAMSESLSHPNLSSLKFLSEIQFTSKLDDISGSDLIVIAIPTKATRLIFKKIKTKISQDVNFIIASKGIENDSCMIISEIMHQVLGVDIDNIYVLSGPSHAEELALKHPTTVVIANNDISKARDMQSVFSNQYFRVYANDDVLGVQIGGAIKNVISIAAGICDSIGYGDNALSALVVRGLEEIALLASKMGARQSTVFGLSGCGDLVVTAFSKHSRNRYVGVKLGLGYSLNEIVTDMNMVAEGLNTTKSIYQLSLKYNVQMPICTEVYEILYNNKKPDDVISDLMSRDLVDEKIERN